MNVCGVTFEEASHPEMTITWPVSLHIFFLSNLSPSPTSLQFLVTLTSPEPSVQTLIFPNTPQTCYITF